MDFIGFFPVRKNANDKKSEAKKTSTGPVFNPGHYTGLFRNSSLAQTFVRELESTFLAKHVSDKLSWSSMECAVDEEVEVLFNTDNPSPSSQSAFQDVAAKLLSGEAHFAVLNMREIPMDLPEGIALATSLRREDPRDAMVTRRTFGAIQELPSRARIGTCSRSRIMQAKSLRPDLEFFSISGNVSDRLSNLEAKDLDAVLVSWASLRRLNLSPRFYVSLQPEHVTPPACQGIVGVVCKSDQTELIQKLHYIEDSEASWAARCERAFLTKFGQGLNVPAGVYAHRKGTQDPWILDSVIGDANTGEVLRHREIGTSRCKPESLADKAFAGIIAKGARKFLPFRY